MAVMEAQMWCDKMENKQEMAEIIGRRQWLQRPVARHHRPHQGRHQLRPRPQGRQRHRSYSDEVLGQERRNLLSLEEPRHLVRHREHPLGQVRGEHRYQGAGRQDQPQRPLAAKPRKNSVSTTCRRATAAASRNSSTARPSIPPIPMAYLKSLGIKRIA